MALDPVSLAVGFIAAYLFSLLVVGLALWGESREAKKEQNEAVNKVRWESSVLNAQRK